MNRDADKWKDGRGNDLFTPVEKQIRKQIWWSCCIADKYVEQSILRETPLTKQP